MRCRNSGCWFWKISSTRALCSGVSPSSWMKRSSCHHLPRWAATGAAMTSSRAARAAARAAKIVETFIGDLSDNTAAGLATFTALGTTTYEYHGGEESGYEKAPGDDSAWDAG